MPPRTVLVPLLLAVAAATAAAHDLFLRLDSFFVPAHALVQVTVLNGTFDDSENAVDRARLADLSLVTPAGRRAIPRTDWRPTGKRTTIRLRTGTAGTYVVGASTLPRRIALTGADFNAYLKEDGLPDLLAERRRAGELGKPATERYAKHVKALVQVGATRDSGWARVLGYPAEIVPLQNPYALRAGDTLRVHCLVDGKAVANQTVLAGGRHASHARGAKGAKGAEFAEQALRTDGDGVARVPLAGPSQLYVKFIRMVPVRGEPGVDYESKWATLTFEVR